MTLIPDLKDAFAVESPIPVRVTDSETGRVSVLLRSEDFDWIRSIVEDEPEAPRIVNPTSQDEYALVPEERYDRFKGFFEDDPPSPAERAAQLREFGRRAGWDDPAMDVYDTPD